MPREDYCMDCFAVENPNQDGSPNKKKECAREVREILQVSMALSAGRSCVEKDVPKFLDAQKGNSGIVIMMEEKLNAISEMKLGTNFATRMESLSDLCLLFQALQDKVWKGDLQQEHNHRSVPKAKWS
ncbi:unnamed protein product [Caenorhabditis nigoni]